MMGWTWDLETAEPQEIAIKACVLLCNALPDKSYRNYGGKKQVLLHSFNLPKCIVVALLMMERLFISLLF